MALLQNLSVPLTKFNVHFWINATVLNDTNGKMILRKSNLKKAEFRHIVSSVAKGQMFFDVV